MAFKIFVLAALVVVCQGLVVPAPAYGGYPAVGYPAVGVAKVATQVDDYDPNPQYSYSYNINDAITGDAKSQQETRSGDVVTGSYSLIQPDGIRRIVEYTSDPHNGFNAVVHNEPVATKVIAPIAKVVTPFHGYAAPVAKIATPYGSPYGYPYGK